MRLLRRFFAKHDVAKHQATEHPYSAEVLCSNWVAPPAVHAAAPRHSAALEALREADVVTILARIYASQHC
jgi:hypothetical protein